MANEITLLIYGTQESNTGLSELLIVGNSPLEKRDIAYPSRFSTSNFCIYVQHTQDYIKYILLCNPQQVRSTGASRAGRLAFAVTIKRGYKLADGATPYDLLLSVRNEFMKLNMTYSTDGIYTFNPGMYDPVPFRRLIASYQVVESPRYIQMDGSLERYLVIPDESKIKALLRDTHYNKFAENSCICIALSGTDTDAIDFEIPRMPVYTVMVNGKREGTIRGAETFSRKILSQSLVLVDTNLSFTLDQLKAQSSLDNSIYDCIIDDANEEIRLGVKFRNKEFKRVIEFNFGKIPAQTINAIKDSFRLVAKSSEEKIIKLDLVLEGNVYRAYTSFMGADVERVWMLEGDRTKCLYDFTMPKSYDLDATFKVAVKGKLAGICVDKVPEDIIESYKSNKKLSIALKLNYSPTYTYGLVLSKEKSNRLVVSTSNLTIDSESDVDKLEIIGDGYNFEKPKNTTLNNGWLIFDMPSRIKPAVTSGSKGVGPASVPPENTTVKKLDIKGINQDVTIDLKFEGSTNGELRIIRSFKGKDTPYDGTVELPSNAQLKSVEFISRGYYSYPVTANKKVTSLSMPKLTPYSPADKTLRIIKRFHIVQYLFVFVLAFVLGYCTNILWDKFAKSGEQSNQHEQTETNDINVSGGPVAIYAPLPNDDAEKEKAEEERSAQEVRRARIERAQPVCKEFIRQCEYATLPFEDIASLSRFVEDNADIAEELEGYAKLEDYAKYYSDAYAIFEGVKKGTLSQNYAQTAGTAIITEVKRCYKGDELNSFRAGLGVLWIVRGESKYKYIDTVFLTELYANPAEVLKDVHSFSELKYLREKWFKGIKKSI